MKAENKSNNLEQTFINDEQFMEWLRHYNDVPYEDNDPDWWHSEYSGNIKAMHDAWLAGARSAADNLATLSTR